MNAQTLWSAFGSVQIPKDAAFAEPGKESSAIHVFTSQRDIANETSRTFHTTYVRSGDGYSQCGFPTLSGDIVVWCPSPSGSRLFVARKFEPRKKSKGDETPTYALEVLSRTGQLIASANTMGVHGKLFAGGNFGGLSWRHDEEAIVYSAEPLASKEDKEGTQGKGSGNGSKPLEHEWEADWGEQLVGVKSPRLFVFNVKESAICPLSGIPADISAGQPQWTPDGNSIVFVGYVNTTPRGGLVYYNSRPCKLMLLKVDPEDLKKKESKEGTKAKEDTSAQTGECKDRVRDLAVSDYSPASPRFSPDGKQLSWLTTDASLFHRVASKLRVMQWPSGEAKTVVDVVRDPATVDSFPGLWLGSGLLPERGGFWLGDSRHVVLSSSFRSIEVVHLIDTATGRVITVPPPSVSVPSYSADLPAGSSHSLPSCTVLDVDGKGSRALVDVSSLNQIPEVYVLEFRFGADGSLASHKWTKVFEASPVVNAEAQKRFAASTWEVLQVDPRAPCRFVAAEAQEQEQKDGVSMLPFEAILVQPGKGITSSLTKDGKAPMILFPHGGPHSNFTTAYTSGVSAFVAAGFAALLVNYRGSSGFGQGPLESLPGRCGTLDVHDCMRALQLVLDTKADVIDKDRIGLFGGSHGGFLVTHLIGQYPDMFNACVARNPVTNVAQCASQSDIPDWAYVETGCVRDVAFDPDKGVSALTPLDLCQGRTPTAEDYNRMFLASPIAHAHKVKTPVLMLIGLGDRRVPPPVGMDYHKLLTARGVKTRMFCYPNTTHGLSDSVNVETSVWTNSLLWLACRFDDRQQQTIF